MALHQQRVRDLGVPLCHGQVRMTHLLLEREQIPSVLKPEGSEAVPELIRRELRAGSFAVPAEVTPQHIGFHLQAISGGKQPVLPLTGLNPQILLQSGVRDRRKIDRAALTCLRHFRTDRDALLFGIVVTVPQRQDLTGTDAGVQHDHRNIVVPKLAVIVLVQTPQEALYLRNCGGLDVTLVLDLLQIQLIEGVVL